MYTVGRLYDLEHTLAKAYLGGFTYPWEALQGIKDTILALGEGLGEEYKQIAPQVWVHNTAKVFPSAYLGAPCIIGAGAEVRHCAFIRGSALVGENCVVGNSTELKNVILFDRVQVPHYNYVGDSILGYRSHMGAGSITSNVKSDKSLVVVRHGSEAIPTGMELVLNQDNNWSQTIGGLDPSVSYYVQETSVMNGPTDMLPFYETSYQAGTGEAGASAADAAVTGGGTVTVTNKLKPTFTLPETGGVGTHLYTGAGALLILIALGLLYKGNKGKRRADA